MPSFFSVEFYRRCWDVTTNEVRLRVKSAIYPKQEMVTNKYFLKSSFLAIESSELP